jgi:hypothetical protein
MNIRQLTSRVAPPTTDAVLNLLLVFSCSSVARHSLAKTPINYTSAKNRWSRGICLKRRIVFAKRRTIAFREITHGASAPLPVRSSFKTRMIVRRPCVNTRAIHKANELQGRVSAKFLQTNDRLVGRVERQRRCAAWRLSYGTLTLRGGTLTDGVLVRLG